MEHSTPPEETRSVSAVSNTVPGAFFLIVGALFLGGVFAQRGQSRSIPGDPGPWMMPVVLGGLLVLGGTAMMGWSLWNKPGRQSVGETTLEWKPPVLVLAGVIAYVLLLPWLGFLLSTPLFVVGVLLSMRVIWWRAVLTAVVLTTVGHLVFAVGFRTPLPDGFWS